MRGVMLNVHPFSETGLYLLGLHQVLARTGHTEFRQTQFGLGLQAQLCAVGPSLPSASAL